MSEERTMILQMLADGKISASEAERLLQALEESEEPSLEQSAPEPAAPASKVGRLGSTIDAAMQKANEALDRTLRSLEGRLQQDRNRQEEWQKRIGETATAALERIRQAEERAAQAAAQIPDLGRSPKVRVVRPRAQGAEPLPERIVHLQQAAEPGDRLVLTNPVGDVQIDLVETDEISVEARITSRQAGEAEQPIQLRREGSDLKLVLPEVGSVVSEGERIHLVVRGPQALRLQVESTVGDIRVKATGPITTWALHSRVGDIDLVLPQAASCRYQLGTRVGRVEAPGTAGAGQVNGTLGDGQGEIDGRTTMGDIRLQIERGGY